MNTDETGCDKKTGGLIPLKMKKNSQISILHNSFFFFLNKHLTSEMVYFSPLPPLVPPPPGPLKKIINAETVYNR